MNTSLIRDQVKGLLTAKLLTGEYKPGSRIGLAKLSKSLNVSTTPVREALSQLEDKGLVITEPNRGFFVAPLDITSAREIYPIIWTLESLAIELSPEFSEKQIHTLKRINKKLSNADLEPVERVRLDHNWHFNLIKNCKNKLLIEEVKDLKSKAALFELYYMKESKQRFQSPTDHIEITSLLASGDKTKASEKLQGHWKRSLSFIEEWLKQD